MSLKMKMKGKNKFPADYMPCGLSQANEPEEKSFINDRPIGTPAIANEGKPSEAVLSGGKIPIEVTLGLVVSKQPEKLL